MDAISEKLDLKLKEWQPRIAEEVRQLIVEIIEMADLDILDIIHSRQVEQEVLDILDEP